VGSREHQLQSHRPMSAEPSRMARSSCCDRAAVRLDGRTARQAGMFRGRTEGLV
jgi:hypothetical protein